MSGQIVKQKIEGTDIALADVARRLGITPQSLNERLNVKDVKVGMLAEIAKVIGKDLNYFLEDYNNSIFGEKQEQKSPPANQTQVRYMTSNQDLLELIKAKEEIILAQKKTIQAYEKIMSDYAKRLSE